MLNIDFIRQVQASILDETKPFDMDFWGCCIAGHADALYSGRAIKLECFRILDQGRQAAAWMGIPYLDAVLLFTGAYTCKGAVEALDLLIEKYKTKVFSQRYSNGLELERIIPNRDGVAESIAEEELVCV